MPLSFLKRRSRRDDFTLRREMLANQYLSGSGIEVGALHKPLPVPDHVRVQYVDRMSVADLRAQYPELEKEQLLEPDIVDDGETLSTIADASQDFVIANHILEHFENPLGALCSMMRVLKPGGILYLAVPDMRHTFDKKRPVTTLEHLIRDRTEGPEWSRREAYEQWAMLVDGLDPETAQRQVAHYMNIRYSIHFHAWTQREILEILLYIHEEHPHDIAALLQNEHETVAVLRKG